MKPKHDTLPDVDGRIDKNPFPGLDNPAWAKPMEFFVAEEGEDDAA